MLSFQACGGAAPPIKRSLGPRLRGDDGFEGEGTD
jgi:hypothetical protein